MRPCDPDLLRVISSKLIFRFMSVCNPPDVETLPGSPRRSAEGLLDSGANSTEMADILLA